MKRLLLIFLLTSLLVAGLGAARKALVIGNAAYSGKQTLKNPLNDAADLAKTLRELGFSVTSATDLSQRTFKESINDFAKELSPVDEVVFYYSGHGAQALGENYLIPLGAVINAPEDYPYEAVSASWALQRLAVAKISIFILDACRNDPTSKSFGTKGLAKLEPDSGTQYVIYATEKDNEAQDGAGRNSPFAESFIRNLKTSSKKIEDMMKDVRAEVKRATSNQQSPTAYGILDEDFYFNSSALPLEAKTPVQTKVPGSSPQAQIIVNYGSILISSNVEAEVYLDSTLQGKVPAGAQMKLSPVQTGNRRLDLKAAGKIETRYVQVDKDRESKVDFSIDLTPPGFVFVEGGSYMMGSNDGYSNEKPVHNVTLSPFCLAKHELTVAEFRAFVNATGYQTTAELEGSAYGIKDGNWGWQNGFNWKNPGFSQSDQHPVTCISWYDAISYCNWRSQNEGLSPAYNIDKSRKDANNGNSSDNYKWTVSLVPGAKGYRLPSEAEWEYAARSRGMNYKYAWGNDEKPYIRGSKAANVADESSKKQINWADYFSGYDDGYVYTAPVGSFAANDLGAFDMGGNVWEWCWDWYDSGYYAKSQSSDPIGAGSGSSRLVRGGCWDNGPESLRVCDRNGFNPNYRNSYVGVRLVRAI